MAIVIKLKLCLNQIEYFISTILLSRLSSSLVHAFCYGIGIWHITKAELFPIALAEQGLRIEDSV